MAWCHEGYVDPETGERKYGKDVLLRALFSGSFFESFARYSESLSEAQIAAIGGKISPNASAYAPRIAEWAAKTAGRKKGVSPKNLCLWF